VHATECISTLPPECFPASMRAVSPQGYRSQWLLALPIDLKPGLTPDATSVRAQSTRVYPPVGIQSPPALHASATGAAGMWQESRVPSLPKRLLPTQRIGIKQTKLKP